MWFWLVLGVILLLAIVDGFFIVRQQSVGLIERFGRFNRVARAGCGEVLVAGSGAGQ